MALLGFLLFGKMLSMRWWLGTSFIIMGLILIHFNSAPYAEDQDHNNEQWMGLKKAIC